MSSGKYVLDPNRLIDITLLDDDEENIGISPFHSCFEYFLFSRPLNKIIDYLSVLYHCSDSIDAKRLIRHAASTGIRSRK
jgi:hypothetical protein